MHCLTSLYSIFIMSEHTVCNATRCKYISLKLKSIQHDYYNTEVKHHPDKYSECLIDPNQGKLYHATNHNI